MVVKRILLESFTCFQYTKALYLDPLTTLEQKSQSHSRFDLRRRIAVLFNRTVVVEIVASQHANWTQL